MLYKKKRYLALILPLLVLAGRVGICQSASEATGSITGAVTDASTGEPIEGAVVVAAGPHRRDGRATAVTDKNGKYFIDQLDAGAFRIFVSKAGYAPVAPGSANASSPVRLPRGSRLEGINIRLHKGATVSGRAIGRQCEPVANFTVTAKELVFLRGQPSLVARGASGITDSAGRFVITDLPAGKYFVEAAPPLRSIVTPARTDTDQKMKGTGGRHYARTFYPSADRLEGATPLSVLPAAHHEAVDLSIQEEKTANIKLTLIDSTTGRPPSKATVLVRSATVEPQPVIARDVLSNRASLEISDVWEGTYQIFAWTQQEEHAPRRFASVLANVSGRDDVTYHLDLHTGIPVRGMVVSAQAGQDLPLPNGIRISLTPADRRPFSDEAMPVEVLHTGAFSFPSVMAGEYYVTVSGLPQGYYAKQVSFNGIDALFKPVSVGSHTGMAELFVVISASAASIEGVITDSDAQPIAGSTVALYNVNANLYTPTAIKQTDTATDGRFEFSGLAPGRYKVLAFSGVSYGQVQNPDFLSRYPARAAEITVRERERKTITPPHIQVDNGGR